MVKKYSILRLHPPSGHEYEIKIKEIRFSEGKIQYEDNNGVIHWTNLPYTLRETPEIE